MNEQDLKIIKYDLYWELIRGRRSNKGNRWFNFLWPTDEEIDESFTPKFAYLNYLGPGDVAGNHYHITKGEFFCPMGPMELYLEDPKTGRKEKIEMSLGDKEKYTMYYVPTGIAHAVRNPGNDFSPLVVLSGESLSSEKTIEYKII
ncbi:hypothetical protein KKD80_03780 [Patescibacteria group bacterium]|nr:hypothetical protein [Patescibacteria group bacterium]